MTVEEATTLVNTWLAGHKSEAHKVEILKKEKHALVVAINGEPFRIRVETQACMK